MGEGLGDVVTKQSWNSPLSAPALSVSSVTPHGSSLPSSSQISVDPVQPAYLELLPPAPWPAPCGLHKNEVLGEFGKNLSILSSHPHPPPTFRGSVLVHVGGSTQKWVFLTSTPGHVNTGGHCKKQGVD